MSGDQIKSLVDLANKRLNSSEDFEEFQSFVSEVLDLDTIYALIDEKIDHEDGPKVLEYVLVGLSVKPDAQKVVEKVYEYVLNAINTTEIPEKLKVRLIGRLSLELNKLSTEQLIKFINMCKKDIENANENCMQSWKELIPQILKIVSEVKLLSTEGVEMSGAEYKEMIITDICRNKMQTNITVALALMFGRTPLTDKEHELVIKTLCSNVGQMKPQEIPPLVQQILHFCSSGDFLNLFCTLQKYFDEKSLVEDESNAFEIEVTEKKDLLEAKSTVLFLLEDFAKVHSSFVSDITKYIKNSIGAPNMVFGPFMLSFLLTMSCCGPYETIVIGLIKKLVVQSLSEDENIKRSFWLKINYTDIYNVYVQFQVFIKSEISSYEKVFKGLVNLGLSLLGSTSSVFKKNVEITNKIHQLGLFIIVSLVQKRSFITGSVLRKLTDYITSNPTSSQYLECLHKLCKNQKVAVIENNTELLRLFKDIPVGMTDKVTCAVMPVLKISTYLRDNVIMILRKELLSKDYKLRHCAVLGFIEILCSVRVNNFNALSQKTNSQDSWPGLFTQVILDRDSVDIHSTVDPEDSSDNNKTICLEILDILKICFFQKSEIKQTLYRGLAKVTSPNNELCVCINSLLLDHLSIWCNRRVADNKQSLKFDKSIVLGKDNKHIVNEPLEELILLAQHVVIKNMSFEDTEGYNNTDQLKKLLDELVNFYCECNTDEIKVNDSDSLLDIISNVADYSDIIKQIVCVYQAFIVYIVNSWSNPNQDKECYEKLQKLFSKYNHIVEAVLASDKTNKKKDKGNKKNKTEVTGTSKFTEPAIQLDFDVLYKFLSLLVEDVDWNSESTVSPLKHNVRLWEFVLKLVQTYLIEIKISLTRDVKPLNLYENLCKLNKLLYDYFLVDVCEKMKFSQTIVELGLECYLEIIKLVSSYYKKINKFLLDSNQGDMSDELEETFNVLRNIRFHLDKVLEMNQVDTINDDDDDDENKTKFEKIECHLIGCVSVICHSVKSNNDAKMKTVLVWLSSVAEKYSFSNLNNSKEFVTLLLDMHAAYQEDPIMLATLVKNLCSSFGQISKSHKINESQLTPLRIITTWNRASMCPVLCQHLCNELNYVLLCLSRIKAELQASQRKIKTICQDRLKAREKAICHRIVLVILITISFTKAVIPLGQCTEAVFNLLYQVYHTINIVAKHFLARSTYQEPVYKQALLGKLSEVVNNQLSPNVSKFIMFVEHDRPLTDKEKKSTQLKNQTRRQASYIPRVVTELELFVNQITKLGKKCKDQNLINNLKLTSSRDFRLNIQKVQDMISKQNESDESDVETTNHDTSNESQENNQPPKKKRRSGSNDRSVGSPVY